MESTTETVNLDLQKFWLILKRRWLPTVSAFGMTLGLTVGVVCLQKPDYEAEGKLLIKKINQTSAVTELGEEIGELDRVDQQSSPLKTEIEVIRSQSLVQKTIEAFNLQDEDGEPLQPKDFKKLLKLKNVVGTDVVQLIYKSDDSQEAAAVVNKLMSLYKENNVLTNRMAAMAAAEFITKQLPETNATVRQAELALRHFHERNQVVDLKEEARSAIEVLESLESKIKDTQAELANTTARSAMLQKKVGVNSQEGIAMNSLNQSAGVQKVLAEFQQAEGELAVQQTRFLQTHPMLQGLKRKRDALKVLLQERIKQSVGNQKQVSNGSLQTGELQQKLTEDFVRSEVERIGLATKLADLHKSHSIYKQRISTLPKLTQEQRELERQLEAAQSTYQLLLKKLQEVRVAENQNMGNAYILESALVPDKRSLLKPALTLALGFMLSTLFSAGTLVTLEVRDKYIKTLREARERFGYTFLGAIPSLRKKAISHSRNAEWMTPELPVRDTPRLPIAEAYRMLQANLKFLSSDEVLQTIVVTSSVPKEGKSTVSANLATALAQLGHRVLLVDADMRRPMQHHIWELTNAVGLSDVIVNQAEFKVAVKEVMTNLHVLTAGVIPPNPIALLGSKRMASLVEAFSEAYDFVIFDAPPIVVAADALTLGKMTNGVLLVARPGVVDSTSANTAKESLERSGQKVLGLVVNGVLLENESDSYFYFTKEYYVEEDSTARSQMSSKSKKHELH